MLEIEIRPKNLEEAANRLSAIEIKLQDTGILTQAKGCLKQSRGTAEEQFIRTLDDLLSLQASLLELTKKTKCKLADTGIQFQEMDEAIARAYFR